MQDLGRDIDRSDACAMLGLREVLGGLLGGTVLALFFVFCWSSAFVVSITMFISNFCFSCSLVFTLIAARRFFADKLSAIPDSAPAADHECVSLR